MKSFVLKIDDKKSFVKSLKENRLFGLQGEIRGEKLNNDNIDNIVNFNSSLNDKCKNIIENNNKFLTKINAITTGRIKKWQCALNLKNNLIFGNGPEYDRKILTAGQEDFLKQGQDVANGAIYALISGVLLVLVVI